MQSLSKHHHERGWLLAEVFHKDGDVTMATSSTHHPASKDGHFVRDMGVVGLLFASVGSIIGSGWLFGAMSAAEKAGPGSVFAWLIGGVMIILIGLCYAELGAMFPVSGGVVRFPHFSFGSLASYTLGWVTWLAAVATGPIEVLAALQYANNYLPWLQHLDPTGSPVLSGPGFAVAVGMLLVFSAVNIFGIRWFARLNNVLVWWKLFIILLVIAVFLAVAYNGMNFHNAQAGGFLPYGWKGVFSSIATAGVVFSFLGFRQGVELAGETRNPKRNVPIAIIGSIVITAVIYIGLQTAFVGALPEGALDHGWAAIGESFNNGLDQMAAAYGPLAALATVMGLTWLAVLLYIDAFLSPADTGLIYTTVTARLSYAMGRNGNAPRVLTRVNGRGVPWVGLIVTFVVGVVFLLPFPGWAKLVGFATSCAVLSFGSGPVVLMAMRRQLPDHARPFRLPCAHVMSYLGFLSANMIVYWSGWDTVWKLMAAVLIGHAILALHEGRFHRSTPSLEWRSGSWVLVWLAGLTLISYLGIYAGSPHAGNLGVLGFGWSFLVMALFSALVMWLAASSRLSPESARAHMTP